MTREEDREVGVEADKEHYELEFLLKVQSKQDSATTITVKIFLI